MLALVITCLTAVPGHSPAVFVSVTGAAAACFNCIADEIVDPLDPALPPDSMPRDEQCPDPDSDRPNMSNSLPSGSIPSSSSFAEPHNRLAVWQRHASFIGHLSHNLLYTLLHLRN